MGKDKQMDKRELQKIAQAAAKNIKTEDDLNEVRQMLTKITLETALKAELDDHLRFSKHDMMFIIYMKDYAQLVGRKTRKFNDLRDRSTSRYLSKSIACFSLAGTTERTSYFCQRLI